MRARTQLATDTHGQEPNDAQIAAAVAAFRMLGDPTRLRLMWALLGETEVDVTSLTEKVGAARPAVSQHLAKLRLAGLVDTRKDGQRVLYRARDSHVRNLIAEAFSHADHETTTMPRHA